VGSLAGIFETRATLLGEMRQLLKAAGAGVALAVVPGIADAAPNTGTGSAPGMSFPFFPQTQGTYTTEQVQDILNYLVTVEHLGVTVVTLAVTTYASQLQLSPLAQTVLQSTVARDQAHLDFLASMGGHPLTTTFTIPPPLYASAIGLLRAAEAFEALETAAYMTAVREFAELGQPNLTKNAAQTMAVEGESRALVRTTLLSMGATDESPPGNKAFETDLLLYVRDEITLITNLGFIGGAAPPVPYPGRDAALAAAGAAGAAVIQRTPNNASSTFTFTGFPSITGERT
jgi:Ferritin-like domain